jgi:anti-anti-sigma factor
MDDGDTAVIRVVGEIDFTKRDAFRETLAPAFEAGVAIVDFTEASYVDSSVISQLIACNRARVRSKRVPVRVVLGTGVERIFGIAGIDTVLQTFETLEDAERA